MNSEELTVLTSLLNANPRKCPDPLIYMSFFKSSGGWWQCDTVDGWNPANQLRWNISKTGLENYTSPKLVAGLLSMATLWYWGRDDVFSYQMRNYLEPQNPQNHRVEWKVGINHIVGINHWCWIVIHGKSRSFNILSNDQKTDFVPEKTWRFENLPRLGKKKKNTKIPSPLELIY